MIYAVAEEKMQNISNSHNAFLNTLQIRNLLFDINSKSIENKKIEFQVQSVVANIELKTLSGVSISDVCTMLTYMLYFDVSDSTYFIIMLKEFEYSVCSVRSMASGSVIITLCPLENSTSIPVSTSEPKNEPVIGKKYYDCDDSAWLRGYKCWRNSN